jgi:RNA polymerase sigma-70 factor (ECF subfamily)
VPWRLAVAEVDGELAVVALRQYGGDWRPHSVARLTVIDRHIAHIVDYAHCPWVLSAATAVVVSQPS